MSISSYTKHVFYLLILLVALSSFGLTALAADYVVTPIALTLDVEKRDIITQNITLKNNESRQVRLYATVNEVAIDGEGVVESFQSPAQVDRTDTPTSWVQISRQRIELAPGESRQVPFTLKMNPNTKPGEYTVFIGFADASNQPQAQAKVSQGKAPGTLLYISVDKTQNVFLRLEKFVVDRFVTEEKGGVLNYTLANPSSVNVLPKGEVIIYDNNGREVMSLPLNPENKEISTDDTESYSMDVPNDLGLGKYKAFLSVEYGEHLTASVHDTAFFYILPLKKLIVIFIIILISATFLALYLHKRFDNEVEYDGAENVAMYIKEGCSENQHHDIDLSKKNDE